MNIKKSILQSFSVWVSFGYACAYLYRIEDVIPLLKDKSKPLALYIFFEK